MDECIYRQLVYRASFTLVILFAILAVSSACTEYVNRSFWVLKFGVAFLVFFCFWWGENSFFSGWAQFSRVMAFFWLLVQALLLLDFAYDCHEVIMLKADNASNQSESSRKGWLGFYLLLCVSCLVAAVVGLVFLFSDYSECDLGAFFSSITLIFGVFTTIVSVLEVVNKGLLAPSIMFAYSVFMCWYALLSSPDEECNPSADTNSSNKTTSLVVIALVTGAVLLYCVVNGTLILNIFNTEGEGVMVGQHARPGQKSDNFSAAGGGGVTTSQPLDVESPGNSGNSGIQQESSGTGHEIVFFHVMMMLVSCYGAMMLTNWGKPDGTPEGDGGNTVPLMSMWLKILSQWAFLAMQCRALYVAYFDTE